MLIVEKQGLKPSPFTYINVESCLSLLCANNNDEEKSMKAERNSLYVLIIA